MVLLVIRSHGQRVPWAYRGFEEESSDIQYTTAILFLLIYHTLQIDILLLTRFLGKSHKRDSVAVSGWMSTMAVSAGIL